MKTQFFTLFSEEKLGTLGENGSTFLTEEDVNNRKSFNEIFDDDSLFKQDQCAYVDLTGQSQALIGSQTRE